MKDNEMSHEIIALVSSVLVPSLSFLLRGDAKEHRKNKRQFWEKFFELSRLVETLCMYEMTAVLRDEVNLWYLPYERYEWKSLYVAKLAPVYEGLHMERLDVVSSEIRPTLQQEVAEALQALTFDNSPYIPVGLLRNPDFVKTTGYKRPFDAGYYFEEGRPIPEVYLAVALERFLQADFKPSFCDAGRYFAAIDLDAKTKVYDILQSAYDLLVKGEQGRHERRFSQYGGIEEVFVPPLLAVILRKIDNLNQFWDELLNWRRQFEPLREKRRMIAEMARSDEPSAKVDREIAKVEQSVQQFVAQYSEGHSRLDARVPDTADVKFSVDEMEFNSSVNLSSITNYLLGKGLSFLRRKVCASRIKPLPLMKKELDLVGRHSSLIQKLWGIEVEKEDIGIIQEVLTPIPSIGDLISQQREG